MDSDKYSRQVNLVCPACGSDQFSFDEEVEDAPVTCANCSRQMTREELVSENSESTDAHASEIGEHVTKDLANELRKSLRDAFRGNKNIRFK